MYSTYGLLSGDSGDLRDEQGTSPPFPLPSLWPGMFYYRFILLSSLSTSLPSLPSRTPTSLPTTSPIRFLNYYRTITIIAL